MPIQKPLPMNLLNGHTQTHFRTNDRQPALLLTMSLAKKEHQCRSSTTCDKHASLPTRNSVATFPARTTQTSDYCVWASRYNYCCHNIAPLLVTATESGGNA
eukprot:11158256-Lingulodinium_polyedra.AAC.1